MTTQGTTQATPDKILAMQPYRTQIEAALSYADATHCYEDVAEMVAAGHAQFWPGPASCIVTELVSFPRKRVLNVFLAGGTLPELEAMIPIVLDWAKDQGCVAASFTGRRGWARTFVERMGWHPSPMVTFTKPL